MTSDHTNGILQSHGVGGTLNSRPNFATISISLFLVPPSASSNPFTLDVRVSLISSLKLRNSLVMLFCTKIKKERKKERVTLLTETINRDQRQTSPFNLRTATDFTNIQTEPQWLTRGYCSLRTFNSPQRL